MLRPLSELPDGSSSVLVVGGGAREAALALAFSKDRAVRSVYVVPGNCGTSSTELGQKIQSVDFDLGMNFLNLVEFCNEKEISMVVPGPEKYIVEGIKDILQKRNYIFKIYRFLINHCNKDGIRCFCPSKKASILEGSKSFSKLFMEAMGIPTAKFKIFDNVTAAEDYVKLQGVMKIVIKASGLAGGKGVYLPRTLSEASIALNQIIVKGIYGVREVVIEDRLKGQEVSVICICDGYTAIQLPAAQDHKRVYDNDEGPNTGGMGAYSPVPFYTNTIKDNVQKMIVDKTLEGMRNVGAPFVGVLFVGLMLTRDGPFVLEYNVRFGDPEAQVILPLLSDDCGLYGILNAAVESYLDKKTVVFNPHTCAVNVVLSTAGYPGNFKMNIPINIPDSVQNEYTTILHSGTKLNGTQLVSNGGRVLSVVSVGFTIDQALERSYHALKFIEFGESHYRKDIARNRHLLPQFDTPMTYKDAGVSIETADALVSDIKSMVKCTYRPGVVGSIGNFGALFDIKASGFVDPILVSGADGVGTKIKVAQECRIYDTIGIDLVAMNANDIITMGAEPLFFLDYYSCGKLDRNTAKSIISGISKGCAMAGCSLIGGETSEMPSVYNNDEFDLAGFCVGALERTAGFPRPQDIRDKDVLIGLLSDGLHSNGYSLVRYIIKSKGLSYLQEYSLGEKSQVLYQELLRPTKIYVKPVLAAIKRYHSLKALAHITGGGISSNLKRVLNNYSRATIDCSTWKIPPIFKWLKMLGNIKNDELERTFNCGIGMIMVVTPEEACDIVKFLENNNCPSCIIGFIERSDSSEPCIRFENMDEYW